ncbi:MAG TPA: contact-dependent growth inhibition system immunity protein [Solirubrobacteraceae bacterium]|jgi:hypothetical protein
MTREQWAAKFAIRTPQNPIVGLIAGYFNADWELDFPSQRWQDVTAEFVREEPADAVKAVVDELDQLIKSDLNEADLHWLLRELGSGILPEKIGLGNRQWLGDLRSDLERLAS